MGGVSSTLTRRGTAGARGAVAESRLRRLEDGRYEYTPTKGTAFTVTAAALVRRLVALLPPQRLHLTSFHGGYAPNARLRPLITQPLAPSQPTPMASAALRIPRPRMVSGRGSVELPKAKRSRYAPA